MPKEKPCWQKALKCLFAPLILIYHAIRIFCCGCVGVLLAIVWQHVARCCCACWAILCCACCGCTAQFTDAEFPPGPESLGTGETVTWLRLDEIMEEKGQRPQLFEGEIESDDVGQGGLGDCWLMSVIATVAAVSPESIRRLFVTKRYSTYGKYTLQLYDGVADAWEEVVVDNYVPCRSGHPIFAQPHNNEMWAVLLEKAVAKFCGSFENIVGGQTAWALMTLTGWPTFIMSESERGWRRINCECAGGEKRRDMQMKGTNETYDLEQLFYILREYTDKKALMACSTFPGSDRDKNAFGIVFGHAYSLIGAKQVGEFLLLNVRNPWGSGEWTGPWGDGSPLWAQFPHVQRELNYEARDDGAFWIAVEDFVRNFRSVSICVRDTGFNDLALDVHEEMGVCGVCFGCVTGCLGFWCLCRGCRALCCGEEADDETVKGKRDSMACCCC